MATETPELRSLRQKRGTYKGTLTRTKKFLTEHVDLQNLTDGIISQLQIRLEKIEPLWDEYLSIQDEIEILEDKSEPNERLEFENTYCELVGQIRLICNKYLEAQNSQKDGSVCSNTSVQSNQISSSVKLSPITIPSFDGNYTNWLDFKESFKSLVGENKFISEVEKLIHLRSSLGQEPLELIKSLELSAQNYKKAWDLILDRYENKKIIIHSHLRAIFEYPQISSESYKGLRQLFDNTNKHLHALKSMGEKIEEWDRVMIYVISNKFDSTTKRGWESYQYSGDLPTWKDLTKFMKNRCEILEKLEYTNHDGKQKTQNIKKSGYSNSYAATNESGSQNIEIQCLNCKENHLVTECPLFLKLSISERINLIKKLRLCLNCLKGNHPFWKCHYKKCTRCKRPHNILLHLEKSETTNAVSTNITLVGGGTPNSSCGSAQAPQHQVPPVVQESTEREAIERSFAKLAENIEQLLRRGTVPGAGAGASVAGLTCSTDCAVADTGSISQILLSTCIIKIFNGVDFVLCRALLDSGSQSNFISESMVKRLNLSPTKVDHVVKGVGLALSNISKQVNVSIGSCHTDFVMNINCLVLPQITDRLPLVSFNKSILNIAELQNMADPKFNIQSDIDMLLGSSIFWQIIGTEQKSLGKNLPVVQSSKFGWIIAGNLNVKSQSRADYSVSNLNINQRSSLEKQIVKFWEVEEVQPKRIVLSENEKYCEDHFSQNTQRDATGRFIVKMPFKEILKDLGNTRESTLKRFQCLEKRLNKDKGLKKEYSNIIQEYETLGHMREINLENVADNGYFLPHHAVIKNTSLTTRCRVVFDASARSSSGLSLNDVQYCGPTLQQDVFSILLRFRKYKWVMTADVSKMYRQVKMHEDHTKYLRIFWRQELTEKLKCYELQTVTFGTASAPYLAVRCLMELANQNKNSSPLASKVISNDFYMDDLLSGSDSAEELILIQKEISQILLSAGFELRKWLCNNREVLRHFEVNKGQDFSILHIGEDEQNKTLGVYWNSHKDLMQYVINNITPKDKVTKRVILSNICQIFDPLGLLGPIIIVSKLIIQDLWKLKTDWDEQVPTELNIKWNNFLKQLPIINQFEIPRHVCISDYICIELHGFSDSSEKAYGACLYIRCVLSSGEISSKLLCAKSRVAPVKHKLSLPRLELCASTLLANLAHKTCEALEINFNNKTYWTDSMITLCWIQGEASRWKTFVGNRVSEIQTLTNSKDWYHVESSKNPADLLSRGTTPELLKSNDLWWYGPDFLTFPQEAWNIQNEIPENLEIPEQRSITTLVIKEDSIITQLLTKFSNIQKIQRILTYVFCFIKRIRKKNLPLSAGNKNQALPPLSVEELEHSLNFLISEVQRQHFAEEYKCLQNHLPLSKKSKILGLNPFLKDKLIRVGGRLRNSSYNFDKKHPILLPKSHILTELIVRQEHKRLMHCGSQLLLCSLREKYWPIAGRNVCKKICKNCIICFKTKPTNNTSYLMGDLPDVRVNNYFPFLNVGIDYGGPFFIKDRKFRGAKITKAYICLFVCMCTKAIHLELVTTLSTDDFLIAFKRFVSRRGKPANVYSDNGSNFLGTNNELSGIYQFLQTNSQYIAENLANDQVVWHFIPARSPSFGGLWETGIKSVKYHLRRVLSETAYTYEQLSTILCQIEAILNSRPLSPLSSDPEDMTALTPAHFLIGRSLTALPEYHVIDIPQNRLDLYQQLQSVIQHFWKRWQKEYVCELQMRLKWKQNSQNQVKVGLLVLVKYENAATLSWKLGRIIKLYSGSDKIVRVVDIKTTNGIIRRSLNNICCLPIEQ